jgi:hypothetical protein
MRLFRIVIPFALAGIVTLAHAEAPSLDQIREVLESDARYNELYTELWVLRDILALQQGGDLAAQATNFQTLQEQLAGDRSSMLEQLAKKPDAVDLEETYILTANKMAQKLEEFGVRQDSDLGKRLVLGYLIFSQMLLLDNQLPVCELHPFRRIC